MSFYINGGRYLFIDEVRSYPNWSSELRNIFDNFPKFKIVFSGSSALQINKAEADPGRRGDFLIDDLYVFEIWGKNKTGKQVPGMKNSFIVQDDIEMGYKICIPLWLPGFLY